MEMQVLRVGVVGLGLMGTRMARAMAGHDGFQVVRGLDQRREDTERWCSEWEAEPAESWEALLADSEVDLVYIATPPDQHIEATREALLRGKAVWLEKPLAADVESARGLMEDLRAGRLGAARAWMHFPLATLPGLARMRRKLADGTLGAVQRIEILLQFSQWPRTWHHAGPWLAGAAQGGFTREVASHFLYLTQTLCGPLRVVHSQGQRGAAGTESQLVGTLEASGVPVVLTGGVAGGAPDHNRWTLFAERGAVRVEDWSQVSWANAEGWQLYEPAADETAGIAASLDALLAAWHAPHGSEPVPLATLEDGWQVLQAAEALLEF